MAGFLSPDYTQAYHHHLRDARRALPDRASAMAHGARASDAAYDASILRWFNSCEIGEPLKHVRRLLDKALRYAYARAKKQNPGAVLPAPRQLEEA